MNVKATLDAWTEFHNLLPPPGSERAYLELLRFTQDLIETTDTDVEPARGLWRLAANYLQTWEEANEPPFEPLTGGELLAVLLEEHDLNQRQLAEQLGVSQPLISKVLTGKRAISRGLATKLAAHFKLNPSVFA